MAKVISKGVTLYTSGTPNGWKLSCLLKELKYPHTVKAISLGKNEQKEASYLKINPNGRIPAIVDHDNDDFPVFESGAEMIYLAEKAGQLYPQDFNKRHEVNQWLFFMNAGLGPMQGQANHFTRYAPEKIEYAINRYVNETRRLWGVLEQRLASHEWLAADEYTIADIANFCWVFCGPYCGVTFEDFPELKKWVDKILAREAIVEGLNVPDTSDMVESLKDPEKAKKLAEEALNKEAFTKLFQEQ